PGDVDTAHPALGRDVQLDEDVVVPEGQPVGGIAAGVELTREGGMGPQEPDPGGQPGLCNCLRTQYLTRQGFPAMIVASSSIQGDCIRCPLFHPPSSLLRPAAGMPIRCIRTSRSG